MKALTTKIDQSVMSGILRKNTQKDIARRTAEIAIRPTAENTYYRFRLLSFPPDEEFVKGAGLTYYRDLHFLPRYVHEVWTEEPSDKSPTGVRNVRHVIPCPASEYIRVNSNLTKKSCPICNAGNAALQAYTDSNKTNQVAKKKWISCKNEFDALVPVYVVQDPNNDAANGSVRVWRVTEDQYKRLIAIINEAEHAKTPIFNDEAVDLFFNYELTEKSRTNKRTGEVKTWKQNDIVKMGLTSTVYKVSGLDDLVKGLNFDANWFTIPTMDDLQEFYAKYIAAQSSPVGGIPNDIPNDIPGSLPPPPPPAPVVEAAPVKQTKVSAPPNDFPELDAFPKGPIADTKEAPAKAPDPVPQSTPNAADLDTDIDAFMKGIKL